MLKSGDVVYVACKGKKKMMMMIGEQFFYTAIMDDYDITKEIGVGGFGKVYLGTHKENKREVAIKFMDVSE